MLLLHVGQILVQVHDVRKFTRDVLGKSVKNEVLLLHLKYAYIIWFSRLYCIYSICPLQNADYGCLDKLIPLSKLNAEWWVIPNKDTIIAVRNHVDGKLNTSEKPFSDCVCVQLHNFRNARTNYRQVFRLSMSNGKWGVGRELETPPLVTLKIGKGWAPSYYYCTTCNIQISWNMAVRNALEALSESIKFQSFWREHVPNTPLPLWLWAIAPIVQTSELPPPTFTVLSLPFSGSSPV